MQPNRTPTTLDIGTGSILRMFGLLVLILALWSLRGVLAIVLFSIILASAMTPFVDMLHRRRVPRLLGTILVFVLVLGLLAMVIVLFGQLVSDQIRELAANIPNLYQRASTFLFNDSSVNAAVTETIQRWLQSFNQALVSVSSQIITGTVTVFGGLFTFLGILILTFYMVLEQDGFKRFINAVSPVSFVPYMHQLMARIQQRLGGWARGQLLLSLIIGSVSYIGLLLLGVDYAISLALIAGLSELIPIIGPLIGAVPAVLVALGQSPLLAGAVALLYLVIQQAENNFIVPKVMQKTTGLNPIVTILAVLVGGTLGGVTGVILAIPIVLIVDSFLEDFFNEDERPDSAGRTATEDA